MQNLEKIYLGGGCFWCLEAVFQRVVGVENVRSGYSGGETKNPTYEEVSSGSTNHAEVVEITFDKNKITFEEILDIFFEIHDPTTLNQQGADIGTQYRSIILNTSPEQLMLSLKKVSELNSRGVYQSPIVTQVRKFEEFYEAEDYHQNFYNSNPNYPYCRIVIDPKLKKLIDRNKIKDII
jgi:methionine-S-sulfoxide reductase